KPFDYFNSTAFDAKKNIKNWASKNRIKPSRQLNTQAIGKLTISPPDLCPGNAKLESKFNEIKLAIGVVRRNCLASIATLAVVFAMVSAVYERYKWKRAIQQATILETPGGFWDPLDNVH